MVQPVISNNDGNILMSSPELQKIAKYNINDYEWTEATESDKECINMQAANEIYTTIDAVTNRHFPAGFFDYRCIAINNGDILIFGGYANSEWTDSIFSYKWVQNKLIQCKPKMPGKMGGFGCCKIDFDGHQLVLVVGGDTNGDNICIYDVDYGYFSQLNIKCADSADPDSGEYQTICASDKIYDDLTVFGYVRDYWKEETFGTLQYLPQYIIYYISAWFINEYIHIFGAENESHFKISARTLLRSYQFNSYDTKKESDPYLWKEAMLSLKENRSYLKEGRARYIGQFNKIRQYHEFMPIGVYFACSFCDRIYGKKPAVHGHINGKHGTKDQSPNNDAECGEFYLWHKIENEMDADKNTECLICNESCF